MNATPNQGSQIQEQVLGNIERAIAARARDGRADEAQHGLAARLANAQASATTMVPAPVMGPVVPAVPPPRLTTGIPRSRMRSTSEVSSGTKLTESGQAQLSTLRIESPTTSGVSLSQKWPASRSSRRSRR